MKIKLEDTDEDFVMATTDDVEAAKIDQNINGERWEIQDGRMAMALLTREEDLVEKLEAEGYEVDDGEYSPT